MPRYAPCRSCGKTLMLGPGSLPEPMCRPCRLAHPDAKPARRDKGRATPRPRRVIDRECVRCGRAITSSFTRCKECRRGSTIERGYGHEHRAARNQALADWTPGQQCVLCGAGIMDLDKVDLDHTDDRTGYRGLAHRACNRRRFPPRVSGCRECGVVVYGRRKYCSQKCSRAARHRVRSSA